MDNPQAVWAILDDYRYTPVKVERESGTRVYYLVHSQDGKRTVTRFAVNVLPWRGQEADAHKISQKLRTARGERDRRMNDAARWFREKVAMLTARQENSNGH